MIMGIARAKSENKKAGYVKFIEIYYIDLISIKR
jgi:hypothetical protein